MVTITPVVLLIIIHHGNDKTVQRKVQLDIVGNGQLLHDVHPTQQMCLTGSLRKSKLTT
jgi:hypothetical protein